MRTTVARSILVLALLSAAPIAQAQTIDPAFRADIEKLMNVTGAASLGAQMASMVSDSMLKQLQAKRPDVPPRMIEIVQEVLKSEFTNAMDSMMPELIALYAKHLTHDDVKGMLAFYDTPVGRKAVAVMPILAREGGAIGRAWGQANMVRVGETLQKRLQAEGLK